MVYQKGQKLKKIKFLFLTDHDAFWFCSTNVITCIICNQNYTGCPQKNSEVLKANIDAK